jgi:hypothetical protein
MSWAKANAGTLRRIREAPLDADMAGGIINLTYSGGAGRCRLQRTALLK